MSLEDEVSHRLTERDARECAVDQARTVLDTLRAQAQAELIEAAALLRRRKPEALCAYFTGLLAEGRFGRTGFPAPGGPAGQGWVLARGHSPVLLTQEGRLHEFDLYQVPDIEEGLSNIARRHRRAERQQRREATEEAFIDEVSNEAERRFILIKDDDSLNTNGYLWYPMGQVPTMADPTTGRFALTHIEHRDTVTIDFRDWLPQAVATTLLP